MKCIKWFCFIILFGFFSIFTESTRTCSDEHFSSEEERKIKLFQSNIDEAIKFLHTGSYKNKKNSIKKLKDLERSSQTFRLLDEHETTGFSFSRRDAFYGNRPYVGYTYTGKCSACHGECIYEGQCFDYAYKALVKKCCSNSSLANQIIDSGYGFTKSHPKVKVEKISREEANLVMYDKIHYGLYDPKSKLVKSVWGSLKILVQHSVFEVPINYLDKLNEVKYYKMSVND